jgi:hypothetical protein
LTPAKSHPISIVIACRKPWPLVSYQRRMLGRNFRSGGSFLDTHGSDDILLPGIRIRGFWEGSSVPAGIGLTPDTGPIITRYKPPPPLPQHPQSTVSNGSHSLQRTHILCFTMSSSAAESPAAWDQSKLSGPKAGRAKFPWGPDKTSLGLLLDSSRMQARFGAQRLNCRGSGDCCSHCP